MVVFRAVMRLHGEIPPREYRAVAQAVAVRANFEVTPVLHAIAASRENGAPAGSDTSRMLDAYVASMESLVTYLDQLTLA